MRILDLILLIAIGLALVLAGRKVLRDRRQGKTCGGDCAHCSGGCQNRTDI